MSRLILAAAAAALMATSAHAAPGFGASATSAKERTSPIAFFLSFIDFRFAGSAAPISDGESETHQRHLDCETAKTAEAEDADEKKNVNPSGPEPVYLAF